MSVLRPKPERQFPWWLLVLLVLLGAAFWAWKSHRPTASKGQVRGEPSVQAGLQGEGGGHVAADGSVWLWGMPAAAIILPPGAKAERRVAHPSKGIAGVTQISLGACHALALLRDGTVRSSGCNEWGQLGDGATGKPANSARDQWVPVPGLTGVRQVVAGFFVSYAVKLDGSVWAWGRHDARTLGQGFTGEFSASPVALPALSGIRRLVLWGRETEHSAHYALKDDGTVWMWGSAYKLGHHYDINHPRYREWIPVDDPMQAPGLFGVADLAPHPQGGDSGGHLVALLMDGSATLWGGTQAMGPCHQPGTKEPLPMPYPVPGMKDLVSVTLGSGVIGVSRDGSVWRFADRHHEENRPAGGCLDTAEQLLPPGSALTASGSGLSVLVQMKDGSVLAWGLDLLLNADTARMPMGFRDRQRISGLPAP